MVRRVIYLWWRGISLMVTLDRFEAAIMSVPRSKDEQDSMTAAYRAGWDSVAEGADMKNCNFQHFTTPHLTAEWERGAADARIQFEQDTK